MSFHAALVAAIFALTTLGFAGLIVLSDHGRREGEQDPGELPLAV